MKTGGRNPGQGSALSRKRSSGARSIGARELDSLVNGPQSVSRSSVTASPVTQFEPKRLGVPHASVESGGPGRVVTGKFWKAADFCARQAPGAHPAVLRKHTIPFFRVFPAIGARFFNVSLFPVGVSRGERFPWNYPARFSECSECSAEFVFTAVRTEFCFFPRPIRALKNEPQTLQEVLGQRPKIRRDPQSG